MLTAKQIADIPRNEFVKSSVEDKCTCGCEGLIEEHPDERYVFSGKQVKSDCYFRILGNHVDRNPINTPRFCS